MYLPIVLVFFICLMLSAIACINFARAVLERTRIIRASFYLAGSIGLLVLESAVLVFAIFMHVQGSYGLAVWIPLSISCGYVVYGLGLNVDRIRTVLKSEQTDQVSA